MHPSGDRSDGIHEQDTVLQVIGVLFPRLQVPTFVDVGAEKGGIATALFRIGFQRGVLCEPLPSHVEALGRRFAGSPAAILPYAIDREDRTASFHVACDAAGNELDYFHSLNRISDHDFFRHRRCIEVRCRSLGSLLASGEIDADIGLLKIDTEGNDLRVLQGLGPLRPELVMCEFVPPAVYPGWPLSFAEKLIPAARDLGYGHCVAIPVLHDVRYGAAFAGWLGRQIGGFSRTPDRSVAIDVGAHEGKFFQQILQAKLISRLVLFEPHPGNAARLRERFTDSRVTVEEAAVSAAAGTAEFFFGDDTATGSILQPVGPTPAATHATVVLTTSLDDYAIAHGLIDLVNVLKIDTQGSDLEVLRGAERLLRESRPLLVVELIFAPLYENQGDPAGIISWLADRGYRLVGFFDEHFSREGWLAWTDACFAPVARLSEYRSPFGLRGSRD